VRGWAASIEFFASSNSYDQSSFRPKELFFPTFTWNTSDLVMGSGKMEFDWLSAKLMIQSISQRVVQSLMSEDYSFWHEQEYITPSLTLGHGKENAQFTELASGHMNLFFC
jgi:hypothetical protein